MKISVAAGGALTWLPQETILFDRAVLHRRIEVDLAGDARLLLVEPLVFGRTGMGESVQRGELHDRWRMRQNGKLIYAEGTQARRRHRGNRSPRPRSPTAAWPSRRRWSFRATKP